MQILAAAASLVSRRFQSIRSRSSQPRTPATHCPFDLAAYPTGQSYAWGNPPSRSNGFAPAVGYDGHPGGNGY